MLNIEPLHVLNTVLNSYIIFLEQLHVLKTYIKHVTAKNFFVETPVEKMYS